MPEAPAKPDAARSALRSAEAYRLHAGAMLVPTPQRRASLLMAGRALLAGCEGDLPWKKPFSAALNRLVEAGAAAEPVHVGLFEAAVDAVPCPPVAAAYLLEPSRVWEALPDVEELCARLGVTPSRSLGGRADHASVELELLAILCRHEAQALKAGDAEGVRAARSEAERFLVGHVLRWFPRFAEQVRENDKLGVAAAATASAHALLRNEQARLSNEILADAPTA